MWKKLGQWRKMPYMQLTQKPTAGRSFSVFTIIQALRMNKIVSSFYLYTIKPKILVSVFHVKDTNKSMILTQFIFFYTLINSYFFIHCFENSDIRSFTINISIITILESFFNYKRVFEIS